GAFGSPALIDLPLPLDLDDSGWARSLHFLTAWFFVFNGGIYVLSGIGTGGFRKEEFTAYNTLQRSTYLIVVFVLTPLLIMTGLAMSPAVTAAAPFIVNVFGGRQTARTIHFAITILLVLFAVAHVMMVWRSGFRNQVGAMLTGKRR